MGLFQKKQQFETSAPLYSLGLQKTLLIVGLGNPGSEYEGTRHNIGFACLDSFADKNEFPGWSEKKNLKSLLSIHNLGDSKVILVKPTTFMNMSGEAVQAVQQFYKVTNQATLVIHDELDIPFGQIRARVGGSDAGNNGIKSVIQHCGADFGRIRIGIRAETPMDGANFVLAKFSSEEQSHLTNLKQEVNAMLIEYIYSGQLPHDTRGFIVSI